MGIYKCVSDHTEDLTGGQSLAPGEYGDVDTDDPHNAARIADGALVEVPSNVQIPDTTVEDEEPAEATTVPEQTDETVAAENEKKSKSAVTDAPPRVEAANQSDASKES